VRPVLRPPGRAAIKEEGRSSALGATPVHFPQPAETAACTLSPVIGSGSLLTPPCCDLGPIVRMRGGPLYWMPRDFKLRCFVNFAGARRPNTTRFLFFFFFFFFKLPFLFFSSAHAFIPSVLTVGGRVRWSASRR
jgi:hypothetical protein